MDEKPIQSTIRRPSVSGRIWKYFCTLNAVILGFARKPTVYELENPRFTSVNLGFASDNLGFTNSLT